MKKMKSGFTMIELIFVIVIIGILAAVALPKFVGMSSQAHESNIKSFVGTLNRTVGPTLWSKSISEGHNGDISYLSLKENNLTNYVDIPDEITKNSIDLSKCDSTSTAKVIMSFEKSTAGFDGNITCKDGDVKQAPKFEYSISK